MPLGCCSKILYVVPVKFWILFLKISWSSSTPLIGVNPSVFLFKIPTKLVNSPLALLREVTMFWLTPSLTFLDAILLTNSSIFLGLIESVRSPSNKYSFICLRNCSFSDLTDLSNTVCVNGKILSTSRVMLFTISLAASISLDFNPALTISDSKTSWGRSPLGLNGEPIYLSIHLSNLELLYASSLPRVARAFAPTPAPYTNGVNNMDSEPNLTLFINFLTASSCGVSSSTWSKAVGPSNKSPKVPISSTSATKVSPAAPPNTPAENLFIPAALFNLSLCNIASIVFLFFKFA